MDEFEKIDFGFDDLKPDDVQFQSSDDEDDEEDDKDAESEEKQKTGPGGHVPDGSGPHGRGNGPGKGKKDGSGMSEEKELVSSAGHPELTPKVGGNAYKRENEEGYVTSHQNAVGDNYDEALAKVRDMVQSALISAKTGSSGSQMPVNDWFKRYIFDLANFINRYGHSWPSLNQAWEQIVMTTPGAPTPVEYYQNMAYSLQAFQNWLDKNNLGYVHDLSGVQLEATPTSHANEVWTCSRCGATYNDQLGGDWPNIRDNRCGACGGVGTLIKGDFDSLVAAGKMEGLDKSLGAEPGNARQIALEALRFLKSRVPSMQGEVGWTGYKDLALVYLAGLEREGYKNPWGTELQSSGDPMGYDYNEAISGGVPRDWSEVFSFLEKIAGVSVSELEVSPLVSVVNEVTSHQNASFPGEDIYGRPYGYVAITYPEGVSDWWRVVEGRAVEVAAVPWAFEHNKKPHVVVSVRGEPGMNGTIVVKHASVVSVNYKDLKGSANWDTGLGKTFGDERYDTPPPAGGVTMETSPLAIMQEEAERVVEAKSVQNFATTGTRTGYCPFCGTTREYVLRNGEYVCSVCGDPWEKRESSEGLEAKGVQNALGDTVPMEERASQILR